LPGILPDKSKATSFIIFAKKNSTGFSGKQTKHDESIGIKRTATD
jgi:hypothetical protein